MNYAISRHAAMLTIHCQGGTTVEIREGDVVDLDEVVGGQTIAHWLGTGLLGNFGTSGPDLVSALAARPVAQAGEAATEPAAPATVATDPVEAPTATDASTATTKTSRGRARKE